MRLLEIVAVRLKNVRRAHKHIGPVPFTHLHTLSRVAGDLNQAGALVRYSNQPAEALEPKIVKGVGQMRLGVTLMAKSVFDSVICFSAPRASLCSIC